MVARAEPGAPLIHAEVSGNIGVHFRAGFGDAARALAEADVRVREHVQRYVGMPIETRGIVRAVGSGA